MKPPIVDDSSTTRGTLCRILTRNGFTVAEAADGRHALKALHDEATDISLLRADFNMPEMDGIELHQAVPAVDNPTSPPCVLIATETHLATISVPPKIRAGLIMRPLTPDIVVEERRMMGVLEAVSA